MFCKNCGKEVSNEANVCKYCGERLRDTVSVETRKIDNNDMAAAVNKIKSFKPLNGTFWIIALKILSVLFIIVCAAAGDFIVDMLDKTGDGEGFGVFVGLTVGVIFMVKNMIFANIASNVLTIAKNAEENNKKQ